jgi:hypothetical protein
MLKALAPRPAEDAISAVAELLEVDALVAGDDLGAELVEHVVLWMRPGASGWTEASDDSSPVELDESLACASWS